MRPQQGVLGHGRTHPDLPSRTDYYFTVSLAWTVDALDMYHLSLCNLEHRRAGHVSLQLAIRNPDIAESQSLALEWAKLGARAIFPYSSPILHLLFKKRVDGGINRARLL